MSVYTAGAGSDGKLGQGSLADSPSFARMDTTAVAGDVAFAACGSYNTVVGVVSSSSSSSSGAVVLGVCGLARSPKDGSSVAGSPQPQAPPHSPQHRHHHRRPAPAPPPRDPALHAPPPPLPAPAPLPLPSPLQQLQQQHRVRSVAVGNYHALLLTDAGAVYAWGSARYGQLGNGTLLNADSPEPVRGLTCVRQIACGTTYSAAVSAWGELFTWGDNATAQLGHGDAVMRLTPTRVARCLRGAVVVRVSCGTSHAVCQAATGELFSWGACSKDGRVAFLPTPVDTAAFAAPAPVAVAKFACGGWHTTLVLNTGLALEWQLGETPRPITSGALALQSVRDVACGNFHSVCLSDSGAAFSWGRNNCQQLGRPSVHGADPQPGKVEGLPKADGDSGTASKVSAGEFHTAVLCDSSDRFAAALRLLAMVRAHFRKLLLVYKAYYLPIIGRYDAQPVPLTAQQKRKKGFSFALKRSPSLQQQLADPATVPAGSRTSFRGLPTYQQQPVPLSHATPTRNRSATTIATPPIAAAALPAVSATAEDLLRSDRSRLSFGLAGDRGKKTPPSPSSPALLGGSALSQSSTTAAEELFLSEDEIAIIFGPLEEMLFSTARLLALLDERVDQWSSSQTLGDLFLSEGVMMPLREYIDCSDGYLEAQSVLFAAKKRSALFLEFLRELEATSKTTVAPVVQGETDLKSMLIVPVQFIARLFVAVKELIEATPAEHPDARLLESLLRNKLEVLLERVNQNFQFVDSLEILHCTSDEAGNPQLMGGTLKLLIERLTHLNIADPRFQDVFLLTMHTFCTQSEFLAALAERYASLHSASWQARQRVFLVISAWVTSNWDDLSDNPDGILDKLVAFLDSPLPDDDSRRHARHVKDLISMRKKAALMPSPRPSAKLQQLPLPAGQPKMRISDFSPLDIAQCLAVQDHALFRAVTVRELFGRGWEKPTAEMERLCPNIAEVGKRVNRLSNFAHSSVVDASAKHRVAVATRLLELADKCLEVSNISALVAIVYGMLTTADKFRKDLPREQAAQLDALEKLSSPSRNYKALRQHMATKVRPPCVPFLGLTLKDVTFISDGNPDRLAVTVVGASPTEPVINFFKRRKLAEAVLLVRQLQQVQFVEAGTGFDPALWNFCLSLS